MRVSVFLVCGFTALLSISCATSSSFSGGSAFSRKTLAVSEVSLSDSVKSNLGLDGKALAIALESGLSAFSSQFELYDRIALDEVLSELEIQNSALFDASFAGKAGLFRGAQYAVIGKAESSGTGRGITIAVKVVDVQTLSQSGVFTRTVHNGDEARKALSEMSKDIYRFFLYADSKFTVGLAAASLVVPGSGQFVKAEPLKGTIMLGLGALALGTGIYGYSQATINMDMSQAATNTTNRNFYYQRYLQNNYLGLGALAAYIACGVWSLVDTSIRH